MRVEEHLAASSRNARINLANIRIDLASIRIDLADTCTTVGERRFSAAYSCSHTRALAPVVRFVR